MQNSAIEPKTDKLCAQYLAQLKQGSLSGSIAYASAIKQAKLDYSHASLNKLESLLNQLKQKTKPDLTTYKENKHKALFLCVLSFYLGDFIAKHSDKEIHWFAGSSYFSNDPDKSNQLHNKFVCEIAGRFINPTGFLCDKLFQTTDKTVEEFVTQVAQNFISAKLEKLNVPLEVGKGKHTDSIDTIDTLKDNLDTIDALTLSTEPLHQAPNKLPINNQTSLEVKAMSMGFTAELAALTNEQLESDKELAINASIENVDNNQIYNEATEETFDSILTAESELSLENNSVVNINNQEQPEIVLDFLENTEKSSNVNKEAISEGLLTRNTTADDITNDIDISVVNDEYQTEVDIELSLDTDLEQELEKTLEQDLEQKLLPETVSSFSDIHTIDAPIVSTNNTDIQIPQPLDGNINSNSDINLSPSPSTTVLDEASYRLQQTYKADDSYEAKFNINYNSKILQSFALPKAPYIIASVPFGLLCGYCFYKVIMSILANDGLPIISTVFAVVFLLIFIAVWVIYIKSKINVFDNKVSLNTPFKNQTTRFDKRVRFFHASEDGIFNGVSETATVKSNTDMIKLRAADHDGLTEVLMEVEATLLVPSLLTRLQNGETITFELLKINSRSLQYGNKEINLSNIGDYEFDNQYLVISRDDGEVFARINLASEPNINSFLTILTELI